MLSTVPSEIARLIHTYIHNYLIIFSEEFFGLWDLINEKISRKEIGLFKKITKIKSVIGFLSLK